jgi:hypothetical protein
LTSFLGTGPWECRGETAYHRLFAVSHATGAASLVRWGDEVCPVRDQNVGNYFAVGLPSGDVGVLFRWDYSPLRPNDIHYLVLSSDTLQPRAEPVLVGNDRGAEGAEGFQPHAAVAPGGHVLFTQLSELGRQNRCHYLRVMEADGSNPHDAPWQLPCARQGVGYRVTSYPDLLPIEGLGVLLVWDERTGPLTYISRQDVYAVLLTGDGRRASDVIRLTSDAALGSGPLGLGFRPFAAALGRRAVVGWLDQREDQPGIHAVVLDVSELPE